MNRRLTPEEQFALDALRDCLGVDFTLGQWYRMSAHPATLWWQWFAPVVGSPDLVALLVYTTTVN